MLRYCLVAAALGVVLAGPASGKISSAGTVQNKLIVRYSNLRDPTHAFSFYTMPRTTAEAVKDQYSQVSSNAAERTSLWCRLGDYRVCLLFDARESVAGIQVSVIRSEVDDTVPMNLTDVPEWRRQTLLGKDVYSATAYFQSLAELLAGGRSMTANTLTAPNGLYLLQTDEHGHEKARLHVATDQTLAGAAGFTEQACLKGMGKHYFQEMSRNTSCSMLRPYFLLFGPETRKLNGLGFVEFGRPSLGRPWLEGNSTASAVKFVVPNSPDCLTDWTTKYGIFTLHVYFVARPYNIQC